ncbi:hypothetical protein BAY61_20550 [Prauserella marina]|uniref:Uncharacterized protein n=1 Tax=Prauserella marina TaxID=530584 RepID=A0A222VST0_9PSEU|nr:DUF4389 domain-containing protein [Prauserella marina]ASR36974.1 hypothetical protein BAY61_20550 [Prauserella marina]PWV80062.1 uncharacterized protein DUF4389 [Prauserella marina]SDD84026.1 protein of unknown function [Prauserella marina]
MTTPHRYPVTVEASLDADLSRWLWLVKWLLVLPHYLVLAVLWPVFCLLTVVAFVAILLTGRYLRGLFEFNVGIMRWSWRVHYYAYAALGTDRYPPFTIADVPWYPARLTVDYPARLSRGLVLVKWLLAIPHFLIVGLFAGGGLWLLGWRQTNDSTWAGGGLIGILVLVAGVVLLVKGRYPKPLYDFVLGLDRWVVRVGAYAALMTDEYPPFRLEMGGEAESPDTVPEPAPAARWTGGRIAAVVVGALLVLTSMGLLTGGGVALWADRAQRDPAGYLSASGTFSAPGYALTAERVAFGDNPAGWLGAGLGDVRIRVTATDPAEPVFLGIAAPGDAARYLAGTGYSTVRNLTGDSAPIVHNGGAPSERPEQAGIWVVQSSGPGTRTVTIRPAGGERTVVVLNADLARGVSVDAEAGATIPALPWIAAGALALGVVFLGAGAMLIGRAAHLAGREGADDSRNQPTKP